jgi:hypothetical protein
VYDDEQQNEDFQSPVKNLGLRRKLMTDSTASPGKI